jgi:hypothetical protein
VNALWAALFNRLTGATAITSLLAGTAAVYDTQVPPKAVYPLLVYQQQAGDAETVDPRTRHEKYVTVKAITTDSFKGAEAVDAAVSAQLDAIPLSVSGHTVIWQRRTADVRYVEVDPAGRNYYHVGGTYYIRLAH